MNDTDRLIEKSIQEYQSDPEFVAEGLALKVTEQMLELLERKGLSQTWLAESMKVSRAHISRILNTPPNMTFLTLSRIAIALGVTPDVELDSRAGRPQCTGSSAVEDAVLDNLAMSVARSGTTASLHFAVQPAKIQNREGVRVYAAS